MVASRQVVIPIYGGIGRPRGRGFCALAQVIGKTVTPFLRKYMFPAAKRVGADLLEFAAPKIAEVVSGRKNFKATAKSVGRKTLRKQLCNGNRKITQAESFQQQLQNKPVGCEEILSQTFLINHVEQVSVPTFCGTFWKFLSESPSS